MRPAPAALLSTLALAFALPGCGIPRSVGRALTEGFVEEPGVELVDLVVTRRTAQGVAFAAAVEVDNPNPVEIPLAGVWLSLRVEGLGVFEAPSPPRVSLPPAGVRRFTLRGALPAPTPSDAPVGGRTYRCEVTLRYVPPGEVREIATESGLPLPVARTAVRGTLGAPGTPGSPRTPGVAGTSGSSGAPGGTPAGS